MSGLGLWGQAAPEPVKIGNVVVNGSLRSRVENWGWFTPDTGNPDYTFLGNQLRLSFSQTGKSFDWMFDLEAPVLLGMPDNAVATGAQGQLGMGATYYVSNHRNTNAAMLFPKQAFVRMKNLWGESAASLRLGRFEFMDGSEVTAKDPTLGVVKRDRVHQRLLGPFGFTHVWRSFDGAHFIYNKSKLNVTAIGATPTRGVFQVDGWGWNHAAFGYGSVTGQVQPNKQNTGEWRLFGIFYDDWRPVVKQDNRPAPVRAADLAGIRIGTVGGHYVHAAETAAGTLDFLVLGAGQFGKWGLLDHRAGMIDVEGGFQPKILPRLKPWLRAGYYYGSGDGNPNDNTHGTFFQMLPTARPFARFPFFDMLNNEDGFAMLTVRPHKLVSIKSELHWLRLANRNDLWYNGGGLFQPWTFGYQSRPSSGGKGLANLYDLGADVTVNAHASFSLYYGYADGKSVIHALYPKGDDGHLAFAELTLKF